MPVEIDASDAQRGDVGPNGEHRLLLLCSKRWATPHPQTAMHELSFNATVLQMNHERHHQTKETQGSKQRDEPIWSKVMQNPLLRGDQPSWKTAYLRPGNNQVLQMHKPTETSRVETRDEKPE